MGEKWFEREVGEGKRIKMKEAERDPLSS